MSVDSDDLPAAIPPTKTCSELANLDILGNVTDSMIAAKEFTDHPLVPSVDKIMAAIPKRCFERSFVKSSMFLIKDIIFVIATAAIFLYLEKYVPSCLSILYWAIFAVVEGTIATGIWVIGHECGHGSYCESKQLCDAVGYVTHSVLLVPYFSWQYTHQKHHQYTNHLIWGDSHVPFVWEEENEYIKRAIAVFREKGYFIWATFTHLVIGWWCYIFFYQTGGRCDYLGEPLDNKRHKNHFSPWNSQLFPPEMSFKVFLSSLGIIVALGILGLAGYTYGWATVLKVYWFPYMIVNAWLVFITFLQHTQPNVPHFGTDSFTWLRGALATIDRHYPKIIDELHHHIGTTHVLHHIIPRIPHYHAVEASDAIVKCLGPLYRNDKRDLLTAAYEALTTCQFIDGITGVQYFKGYCDVVSSEKMGDSTPKESNSNENGDLRERCIRNRDAH